MLIQKIIKDMCTEKDGESYCPARIQWIIGTIVYFACTAYTVYSTGKFDFQAWAIGFGAIMAAGGFSIKVKESTEQPLKAPQV